MRPRSKLLPVAKACEAILEGARALRTERVPLMEAHARVLARDVTARRDQPAFDCSAMDGYAVRHADVDDVPVTLKVAGESRAGLSYRGRLKAGTAVRIYTGAPMPGGSDAVVIQENTVEADGVVTINQAAVKGQFVRRRGFDFRRGEVLIDAGRMLTARDIGLAASANCAVLPVRRKPVVAIIGTGDELVLPGERPTRDQIVSSNNAAVSALVSRFGGQPWDFGIVPDRTEAIMEVVEAARSADIMLTLGGASVGKHDLVQDALSQCGVRLSFWRIAMRPGKPLMFARRGRQRIVGLPGNPVSALVCSRVFVKPLIDALLGLPAEKPIVKARLGAALKANDRRQDYVRARLTRDRFGNLTALPFSRQDSSMQRLMAESDALIIRKPFARAATKGTFVDILPIDF